MKKSKNKKSKASLPPIVPPEIVEKFKKQIEHEFGFTHEGDYTISIEFGMEKTELFNTAFDRVRDNDSRQRIRRPGKEVVYVTFNTNEIAQMLNLYNIVTGMNYYRVYINHRHLPYAESLWIPFLRLLSGS